MPERSYEALDIERRREAIEYVPGYDWIPGKFGPPPGIAKPRKDKFGKKSELCNLLQSSSLHVDFRVANFLQQPLTMS